MAAVCLEDNQGSRSDSTNGDDEKSNQVTNSLKPIQQ